jgi:hypothetical protein
MGHGVLHTSVTVPTQFKATQLVVARAVWAIPLGLTLKLLDFNLSILWLGWACLTKKVQSP